MSEESRDPVGSVGDEAAKLLGALADWAGDSSAGWAGWARQVDEHLATGAPECRVCPICRTVHVIREAGPEVREHLASAAASLMQAAAGVLAASAAGPASPGGDPGRAGRDNAPRTGSVQRIDLDDPDDPDDPDDEEQPT